MTNPVLRVSDLHVRYPNGAHALRGVGIDVHEGECVAVVGESGSGKTTLARSLLRLLPRGTTASGVIMVGDVSLLEASAAAVRDLRGRAIGYVPQDPSTAFDPVRRVEKHLSDAWSAHGQRPPQGWAVEQLAALGIPDAARRARQWPHQWSGGMLQRATIAAATAHGPAVTVADEPTSAVDADLAHEILRTCIARSRSVLLFSHDLPLVATYADRVVVLYAGVIVETGTAHDVMSDPRHPYSRALLASAQTGETSVPPALTGDPPDLRNVPPGCAFHPRCPVAVERCHRDAPALVRGLACWVEDPR